MLFMFERLPVPKEAGAGEDNPHSSETQGSQGCHHFGATLNAASRRSDSFCKTPPVAVEMHPTTCAAAPD